MNERMSTPRRGNRRQAEGHQATLEWPRREPMEQREERPNLFGLSQVVTEEGESKEEGEANLLLAQGRMERSGMAPWVSRTTHKNNALQGQKPDYM